jgi:molybdopterin-guanine dinucleotide biosynthesis protein A
MNRPRKIDATVLGVILAGGASARMGRDKAMAPFRGTTMAERVAAAVTRVADETVVAGRTGTLAGLSCIPDNRPAHRGPLAGLATALSSGIGNRVLLVAVDQPLVRPETLAALLDLDPERPGVPIDTGVRQVTCAAYPASLADAAAAADIAGWSIQRFLDGVAVREVLPDEWRSWGEDGRSWFSVDGPDDITEANQRYPE